MWRIAARRPGELRAVALRDLRGLAQFTVAGAFRPLKSAPNLARGWRAELAGEAELWAALNVLYPGRWRIGSPRKRRNRRRRRIGISRRGRRGCIASRRRCRRRRRRRRVAACCAADFCLKRRLWTVEGLAADEARGKSIIPCLEPCAVMLEFARKIARLEQGVNPEPAEGGDGWAGGGMRFRGAGESTAAPISLGKAAARGYTAGLVIYHGIDSSTALAARRFFGN